MKEERKGIKGLYWHQDPRKSTAQELKESHQVWGPVHPLFCRRIHKTVRRPPHMLKTNINGKRDNFDLIKVKFKPPWELASQCPRHRRIQRITFYNHWLLKRGWGKIRRASKMATASASFDSIHPTCLENKARATPLLLWSTPPTPAGLVAL